MRVFRNRIGYAQVARTCCRVSALRSSFVLRASLFTFSLRFASLASVALWLRVRPPISEYHIALYDHECPLDCWSSGETTVT